MFKLTIFKSDLSVYWVDYFNSINELNKWLDIEKTRPYWDLSWTHLIEDISPVISEEQRQIEKEKMENEQYLSSTDWYIVREFETGIKTPNEIKNLRNEARLKLKKDK